MDRRFIIIIVLIFLAIISIIFSTTIGAANISAADTVKVILNHLKGNTGSPADVSESYIILNIRLPRILLGFLVGASLAVAGVSFQGLMQNPLADPYTIGVSSGAAVGAALAFLLPVSAGWLSILTIPLMGFLGGGIALFAVYQMAHIGGKVPVITLLLAGVVVSSFLSAVISVIMLFAGEALRGIFFWLAGGLAAKGWLHVGIILPYFFLGGALLFYYTRDLNVLLMGEDTALSLGVEVEKVKRNILFAASLVTAAAVSVSGMIGFVGLIIPHAVRMVVGPDHRFLLPASAVSGGIFLVWADIVARVILLPSEIPVGIITAFLGAPFFMYLLRKRRHDFRF
ncbi:MAG: FecCD family ABC transporter permease [Dethiobacteria bacterium]